MEKQAKKGLSTEEVQEMIEKNSEKTLASIKALFAQSFGGGLQEEKVEQEVKKKKGKKELAKEEPKKVVVVVGDKKKKVEVPAKADSAKADEEEVSASNR